MEIATGIAPHGCVSGGAHLGERTGRPVYLYMMFRWLPSWRHMPGAARVCELPGRALTHFFHYFSFKKELHELRCTCNCLCEKNATSMPKLERKTKFQRRRHDATCHAWGRGSEGCRPSRPPGRCGCRCLLRTLRNTLLDIVAAGHLLQSCARKDPGSSDTGRNPLAAILAEWESSRGDLQLPATAL